MSDSQSSPPRVSIAITPMHRTEEGIWEGGPRQGAAFFLVELVQGEGEDAEVVVECRDERAAALAARVAVATATALGLAPEDGVGDIEAFDDETAEILAAHPTPEIELPAGEWRGDDEEDDEEDEEDEDDEQDEDDEDEDEDEDDEEDADGAQDGPEEDGTGEEPVNETPPGSPARK